MSFDFLELPIHRGDWHSPLVQYSKGDSREFFTHPGGYSVPIPTTIYCSLGFRLHVT